MTNQEKWAEIPVGGWFIIRSESPVPTICIRLAPHAELGSDCFVNVCNGRLGHITEMVLLWEEWSGEFHPKPLWRPNDFL